jgi:hypothetical protein
MYTRHQADLLPILTALHGYSGAEPVQRREREDAEPTPITIWDYFMRIHTQLTNIQEGKTNYLKRTGLEILPKELRAIWIMEYNEMYNALLALLERNTPNPADRIQTTQPQQYGEYIDPRCSHAAKQNQLAYCERHLKEARYQSMHRRSCRPLLSTTQQLYSIAGKLLS